MLNEGNEIYKALKLKYDAISKSLKEEQYEIAKTLQTFDVFLKMSLKLASELIGSDENSEEFEEKLIETKTYIQQAKELMNAWEEKDRHNKEEQIYLDKIGQEISQMKEGSIALVNQITTVSKMRIYDPRNAKGVLSGISLSETGMEKINKKMKDLYIF